MAGKPLSRLTLPDVAPRRYRMLMQTSIYNIQQLSLMSADQQLRLLNAGLVSDAVYRPEMLSNHTLAFVSIISRYVLQVNVCSCSLGLKDLTNISMVESQPLFSLYWKLHCGVHLLQQSIHKIKINKYSNGHNCWVISNMETHSKSSAVGINPLRPPHNENDLVVLSASSQ